MHKQINVLVIAPALIPSVNIGIIAPFQKLKKDGFLKFKVILSHMYKKSALNDVDLVVFCRNSEPSELYMLEDILTNKIRYIYEIDDNFFRIPTDTPLGEYHREPLKIDTLKKFISNASMVRVYSDILKLDAGKLNNNVVKNKLYFDTSLIKNIEKDKKKKIRIIYATSRIVDKQQEIFEVALKKIAIKFKDTVEIYFWGAKPTDTQFKKFKNVYHLKPIYNYEKFIKAFYKMNFDIGLAPIFEGKFYNSKTNNKYREYGSCEIAGIYSDELLYNTSVQDRVNGILVTSGKTSWYEALETLVLDDVLRKNIIENATKDISNNYIFSTFCEKWKEDITNTLKKELLKKELFVLFSNKIEFHFGVICDNQMQNKETVNLFKSNLYILNNLFLATDWIVKLEVYDNYNYQRMVGNYENIIIFSDNINFISCISSCLFDHQNIYVFSSEIINLDIPAKNLELFLIPKEKEEVSIYQNYDKSNIYEELICFFEKNTPIGRNKKSLLLKMYIYIIRSFRYLSKKTNSIKIRLYTYLKIFRINYLD